MKTVLVFKNKLHNQAQVYWVESDTDLNPKEMATLNDHVESELWINPRSEFSQWKSDKMLLVSYRAGVTDNAGTVFKELLTFLPSLKKTSLSVHSGLLVDQEDTAYINPLIHHSQWFKKSDLSLSGLPPMTGVELKNDQKVKEYSITSLGLTELKQLSDEQRWALSTEELAVIQKHYLEASTLETRRKAGLAGTATDVEMEVLAQTWSEHCKHKIFNAEIDYSDSKESFTVNSIYSSYIKQTTKQLNQPWAISVFKDNAGVVDWDKHLNICIKVETHNSPSALDPYGGALTGILGVNRDILGCGMGFRPIANTDVFCVGDWNEAQELPEKLLHPKKILKGIHKGVQDGGNKSGIPTVNGAIHFDTNFTGKPLVYCGTVGVAPKMAGAYKTHEKYHAVGDKVVMLGGRVGLDGIHGATMSSIALDKNTPQSMVQIGDPFTQKKVGDLLLEARDKNLFTGVTDNGAGGLSSSVGEMCERTGGAWVDLSLVPLKYPGLNPWEIIVSESQERMTLAVHPSKCDDFLALCHKRGVEATVIGEFTDSGFFDILYKEKRVAYLDLEFLHNGLPKMKLKAHWDGPRKNESWKTETPKEKLPTTIAPILMRLMSDRNIASKESFIRQYDHEVQAATFVKPFDGMKHSAPNDGGVIGLEMHGGEKNKGIAIASGIAHEFSYYDTALSAKLAVDECYRHLIALGANPEKMAMTDNFCWPDPLPGKNNPDHSHKLAGLVRSNRALQEICLSYQVPLISGKDSMKNDYKDESVSISVPPTLLMTGIGFIEDLKEIRKSSIPAVGMKVYRLGLPFAEDYFGAYLAKHFDVSSKADFRWDLHEAASFYKKVTLNRHLLGSLHDVSQGGVLASLCESLIQFQLGFKFDHTITNTLTLFSEYPSQFIVSVAQENVAQFETTFPIGLRWYLGETQKNYELEINQEKIALSSVEQAWRVLW